MTPVIAVSLVAGFLALCAATLWVFAVLIPACADMLDAPDFDERNADFASTKDTSWKR